MIFKVIAPLLAPVYFLCGCILIIWASRLKPHSLALEKFGIRVVAPKDYGSQDNHGEAYTALALLKRFDEEKMELVEKHIRIIFLFGGTRGITGYMRTGRVCLLNLQKFPECPAGTMPITIAGILVYVASLAQFKIKVPFVGGHKNIKNICKEAEQQTVEKLSKILCE